MYKINFIPHTADIAVKIEASSLEELFRGSAEAWLQTVLEEAYNFSNQSIKINLTSNSPEELLVNFLNELNYLLEVKKIISGPIRDIIIEKKESSYNILCEISITPLKKEIHKLREEIKAVTYHKMNIKKDKQNYSTSIVFDI